MYAIESSYVASVGRETLAEPVDFPVPIDHMHVIEWEIFVKIDDGE